MKATTKIMAFALVAGLAVCPAKALAQKKQGAWKGKLPLMERAMDRPDTSQFGVCTLLARGDTSTALVQQARVVELAKKLAWCRTGEEFCKAAIEAQRSFYKSKDRSYGSLSNALKTGSYDCRTLSAETWFDVAVLLGLDAKVVFVEGHVFLEVAGHCLEANRNEQYPSSQLPRRHTIVYLKTSDKKALMAIDYVDRGAEAWAKGDTAGAIRYAKMAAECAPALPLPHENLSIYLEGVDLKASNEEHRIYLRLLPGMGRYSAQK